MEERYYYVIIQSVTYSSLYHSSGTSRLVKTSTGVMMISRKCRNIIIACLLLYLSVLLICSNIFILQKCLNRHRIDHDTLLEFNFQLKKNGERETYISNGDVEITNQDVVGKENVQSKEIIFINQNQYGSGVVQLEKTKIRQSEKNEISVENYHKLYNSLQSRNTRVKSNTKLTESVYQNNRKKFIFSLRYYEQLSMATKNLLSLASLATHTNRHLVMPFVNNSRFCGLRLGVSMSSYIEASKYNQSYLENDYNGGKFNSMDKYFDVNHLNNQLKEHGYTSLAL